jgi:hypothetical protein
MSRLDDAAKAVLKECFFDNDEDRLALYVELANDGEVNSNTPYKMAAVLITEE